MTLPLHHSFTAIIAGPSRAGKSTFVARLLKFHKTMITPPPDKIYYCYGEWQKLYESPSFEGVEFHHGDIDINDINKDNNNLILYDDLMTQCNVNMEMMCTKYSHHRNASVIFITQNIFQKSHHLRTMSLNASYLVLFKNPRDVNQISYLSRQMYPKQPNFLTDSFTDATEPSFGYLFIDLNQETEDILRIRTKIFLDEKTYTYVPKNRIHSLQRYTVNKQDHEPTT